MKKYITLLIVILLTSCINETEITITKVSGSPEYANAKLSLEDPIILEDEYEFKFNVHNLNSDAAHVFQVAEPVWSREQMFECHV